MCSGGSEKNLSTTAVARGDSADRCSNIIHLMDELLYCHNTLRDVLKLIASSMMLWEGEGH